MSVSASMAVLVLAAGRGTRMKSVLPKVLLPLLEEPLLSYPLRALAGLGLDQVAAVVGHEGERVEAYLKKSWPSTKVLWQREQKGTGHAVLVGRDWWKAFDHLLVLPGDVPLLSAPALRSLAEGHFRSRADATFLSIELDDPAGYGRVVRSPQGLRIVEHRDASAEERAIREVNSGVYLFKTAALDEALSELSCDNSQGEYYLTDVIPAIARKGGFVEASLWDRADDLAGVNDPLQLAALGRTLRDRILASWMAAGVKCIDPESVWVGPRVMLAPDVFLDPHVQLWGATEVGEGSRIGSFSVLRDARIGRFVEIVGHVHVRESTLRDGAKAGPFSFIRDGAEMREESFVGRFVEVKKSVIGEKSKVPHLSYIGDASVGEGTNIGAGTITCNYDGKNKHETHIGKDCFIGSDTMLVAPLTVGDRAVIGAGSVITHDVPEGALAVARARQRLIEGWEEKKKGKKD
ncbi:bifunctional UDP-N-acetylglucosamine diphosphorylase/glucosamine-1-phosphate N-acetyltransferase GlmU [Aminithiophilus ramosus]|uniref:Bifunctional protein GlmU n=3 Tax=Synergistales TaxID=649776 RepID=A0A9Q7EVZ2_9BACT|nr:bifunctional UDP-N-acetylglucosamine diphosphorylase/glucosamine-1-phosphate N-acetyltransferase GlmU [Aminithiophilus ramosus]QVL35085.1 bifunctional UDP-N-acetylglucosamine diphosphorylase/glucosamine-1-phosphate N-acetyltransferase GlmU [Synergistota bacterium]